MDRRRFGGVDGVEVDPQNVQPAGVGRPGEVFPVSILGFSTSDHQSRHHGAQRPKVNSSQPGGLYVPGCVVTVQVTGALGKAPPA